MKIRIISSREEINSLRPNEKAVHLAFRASNVDFLNLIQKVPRLQMVQVPTSYMKTISKAIQCLPGDARHRPSAGRCLGSQKGS